MNAATQRPEVFHQESTCAGTRIPRVLAMGSIAARALSRSRGRVEPLAAFSDAPYLRAADEIIWVGVRPRSMHPRMLAIAEPLAGASTVAFDLTGVPTSPDHPHRRDLASVRMLMARAAELRERIAEVGPPRGFGLLLVDRVPTFPLDLASPIVRSFAAALASNDLAAIEATAIPLLGLGAGLTPSGDDLVGGAFFARGLISASDAACRQLGERLIAIAPTRTHEISAALLADLIHGTTYGVLHTLVDTLVAPGPFSGIIGAARALTAIGHSSGWDMLTGFLYATASPTKV